MEATGGGDIENNRREPFFCLHENAPQAAARSHGTPLMPQPMLTDTKAVDHRTYASWPAMPMCTASSWLFPVSVFQRRDGLPHIMAGPASSHSLDGAEGQQLLMRDIVAGVVNDRFSRFIEGFLTRHAMELEWPAFGDENLVTVVGSDPLGRDDRQSSVTGLSSSSSHQPTGSSSSTTRRVAPTSGEYTHSHFVVYEKYKAFYESRVDSVLKEHSIVKSNSSTLSGSGAAEERSVDRQHQLAALLVREEAAAGDHEDDPPQHEGSAATSRDMARFLLQVAHDVGSFQQFARMMYLRQERLYAEEEEEEEEEPDNDTDGERIVTDAK